MLIRASNRIGSVVVDAVLKADHSSSITLTKHAVERGSDITDHFIVNPKELSMEIGVSDAGTLVTRGKKGRSVNAFQALQKLQESGVPFTITTRLRTYQNMMIAALSVPDDYTTMHSLKANIIFEQVRIVSSSTVGVAGRSSSPQKTGVTNNGTQQAVPVAGKNQSQNQSVLAGLASTASGLLKGR